MTATPPVDALPGKAGKQAARRAEQATPEFQAAKTAAKAAKRVTRGKKINAPNLDKGVIQRAAAKVMSSKSY